MMKLVFATNNKNKIKEVKEILPAELNILSLKDIGCFEELPETHATIEENSLEKAVYVHEKYGYDCFAEDSGLEVVALNGEPGVDSAHYSGSRDAEANIRLLLLNMRNQNDRSARFKTVFTLIINSEINQFSGIVTGHIAMNPEGTEGFGYDPVFIPDGYNLTYAQLPAAEKSQMSHRAKAFKLMTDYLKQNF